MSIRIQALDEQLAQVAGILLKQYAEDNHVSIETAAEKQEARSELLSLIDEHEWHGECYNLPRHKFQELPVRELPTNVDALYDLHAALESKIRSMRK